MQYRSGFSKKGCENGLIMVSHTYIFYLEEPLLEYLEGENKVMLEELASMQDYGTEFVIRRHDENIEDTETLLNNTHPSL